MDETQENIETPVTPEAPAQDVAQSAEEQEATPQ